MENEKKTRDEPDYKELCKFMAQSLVDAQEIIERAARYYRDETRKDYTMDVQPKQIFFFD